MENSKHVMLIGEGAEKFADEQGIEKVDNEYFFTDKKVKEIRRIKAEERNKKSASRLKINDEKFGTVGCAALDKNGNLAAGTSTGGMANKRWGRVGDVPIIGAGTYANNKTCALSATGHGEYFIRNVVTHDISARMEHAGQSLQDAADEVVMKKLVEQKGSGGVIGIDKLGNITMTFNSQGMFRGYITDKNEPVVAMYIEK
jgi:beta-aspartyl-peptidase (threonine type)